MNTTRIAQLKAFLEESPNDPFPLYALALEHQQEQPREAQGFFEKLLKDFPDYLPTYYPAAHFLWEHELWEAADQVFRAGIRLSKEKGEKKALQELQNAYQNFQFEME